MKKKKNRIIMTVSSIVLAVFFTVSGTYAVRNVRSASDLKGKKVLAGRFLFFVNDELVDCKGSRFSVGFKKQGKMRPKWFKPDEEGYVYVAVPEGQYNIIDVVNKRPFRFRNLKTVPVVHVHEDDAVVNFGTLEVRFYQSELSKMDQMMEEGTFWAHLRFNPISDHHITSQGIAERVGEFAGPIRNATVSILEEDKPKEVQRPEVVKAIFTTGLKDDRPINDLKQVSINDKRVYIFVDWNLPLRRYTYRAEIFDAAGTLIVKHPMAFTVDNTAWWTCTWLDVKKDVGEPGKLKFEIYLDDRKMVEEYLTVLPQ